MAVKQIYRIEISAPDLFNNIDFNLADANEWCNDNCSWWNSDHHWKNSIQNYVWTFSFADESDKVKFILRWL